MIIQWLPFTWDAFATLFTGVAAVIGAVTIGLRQAKISQIQADIQRHQVESDGKIRSNSLKLELLERRSKCIRDLREIDYAFNANAQLDPDDRTKMYRAIQDAELIFKADVIKGLRDIAGAAMRLNHKNNSVNRAIQRGEEDKANRYLEEVDGLEDQILNQLPSLIESMVEHSRLHDVS